MRSSSEVAPAAAGADPRIPNLFILGAPKSGTTFLHHALSLVPTVYTSPVKEPGYFMSTRDQKRGLGYYLDAYFARAAGHAVRCESTPWYLYSDLALDRIARLPAPTPPRFVVMVRRPADRARSMYLDQVRLNRERRSFEDAVAEEMAALESGDLCPDVRLRYVWCGLYCLHIERWQQAFGRDRVHVVVLEDLMDADASARVWQDLSLFLDHDLGPTRFDAVSERDRNPSGTLRWPRLDAFLRSWEGREHPAIEAIKRLLPPGLHRRVLQQVARLNRNTDAEPDVRPLPATLDMLDEYYGPEVERLEELLGRSLPAWSVPRQNARPHERAEGAVSVAEPGSGTSSIRILHLLSRSHRRGAELVAMELADELDREGHENLVVALGPALDGGEEPELMPLAPSRGVGLPELVSRVWKVRRLLAREPVDVVMAHGGWAAQIAALAIRRGGPLLVWQRILGFPDKVWGPFRRRWWAAIARRVDVGVALTEDLADELERLGFGGPVWIIPNSRKPERFVDLDRDATAARLREEVGVGPEVPLVGFVGHLVEQKRPDRALDVLARMRSQGRADHLVLAGAGPLWAELIAYAEQLGISQHVTFLGHRPDVESVLGGVDVMIITSDAEGIPGVAIEALMAGCPVVTVPVGGVTEVVEQGVTGIVLEDEDPATMAEAVGRLLDDATTRSAMSARSRERTSMYTASATAAVYADGLTSALAGRRATGWWWGRR